MNKNKIKFNHKLKNYSSVIFLLALIIFNMIFTPNFNSLNTVNNVITQILPVILTSMGMTIVISTGGIDISVGSVMAISGIVAAMVAPYIGIFLAVVLGIIVAILVGLLNGLLIGKFEIQAMVITLGSMLLIRGIAKVLIEGRDIYLNRLGQVGEKMSKLGSYKIFGNIPIQIIPIIIAVLIVWILMTKTTLGRKIQLVGDNSVAGKLTGINTDLIILIVYSISSAFAGLAGFFEVVRVNVASGSSLGQGAELDAIAAVAIGGTPMSGGKARVFGTVVGALIMQLITLTCVMNNVPAQWAMIVKAIILVIAVYFQSRRKSN